MDDIYYISAEQLNSFFNRLKKSYRVFSPAIKEETGKEADYSYHEPGPQEGFVYNAYRTIEPLKSFFTHAYEDAGDYFTSGKEITNVEAKTVIFGVKSCDIAGHKVQDFVFLEGSEQDSLYRMRRENTIFVSSDCTDFKQVCHCLGWDILPHPTEGFDLNLSSLNGGYVVEAGSASGRELINRSSEYFSLAKDEQIESRRQKRENFIERLKRHIAPQKLVPKNAVQELVREGYNMDTWKQFMLTCVECGGCNFICDTCHCFLLADKKGQPKNKKARVWDSCLYANYAKVAGGANPLKTRAQRLRNRFVKKFDFFVDNLGMPACCGCGRCIEVCPGKIDIREVLKDLAAKITVL